MREQPPEIATGVDCTDKPQEVEDDKDNDDNLPGEILNPRNRRDPQRGGEEEEDEKGEQQVPPDVLVRRLHRSTSV